MPTRWLALLTILACDGTPSPFDAEAVNLEGVWDFIEAREGSSSAGRRWCHYYTQVTMTPYDFADTTLDYLAIFADSATSDCARNPEEPFPYFFAGEEFVVRHAGDSVIIKDSGLIRDFFAGRLRSPILIRGKGRFFAGQTWIAARPGLFP